MADNGSMPNFTSFDEAVKHAIKLLIDSFMSRMPLSLEQLVLKFFDTKTLRYWRHEMTIKYHIEEKIINNVNVYIYIAIIIAPSFFDKLTHLRICAVMPDTTDYKDTYTQTVLSNENEFSNF